MVIMAGAVIVRYILTQCDPCKGKQQSLLTFQVSSYCCLSLICRILFCTGILTTVRRQTAVAAYFSSTQLLLFVYVRLTEKKCLNDTAPAQNWIKDGLTPAAWPSIEPASQQTRQTRGGAMK